MPVFAEANLTEFASRLFEAAGLPRVDAHTVARGLVGANLRGHDSHGVMRIPQYLSFLEKGEYCVGVDLRIEHETLAVVACDAQWGFGQVQAHRLLDLILPKARALGLAAGVASQCGHIGRLGEYAERAAASDMLLIATVNNDGAAQRVAPPGGIEPRLGTNPLCIGAPTDHGPLVLDFGTSVVAEGKVRVHYLNGKARVPEGWLLDSHGTPTTDSRVLYEPPLGSILPMGGAQAYKGFGLAMLLDVLSGGLSGGRTSYPSAPMARGNNVVFLLLDPRLFAGREHLVAEASGLANYIRTCTRSEECTGIVLPGDPEKSLLKERQTHGIPIADGHWNLLCALATRFGVELPDTQTHPAP
jgi:uncharacterized oxidoreductase